jgi:intraflagellar transport protein 52
MTENKLKIAVSGIKKETITTSKKFSKFIKFLKNFSSLALIKEEMSLEKLKATNILIISGPRSHYKPKELETIEKYFEEGGSIYMALGEGGDEKNNSNINELLHKYGVCFNEDSVVRTSFYRYMHPKECYIEDSKFHTEFSKTIKSNIKKKPLNSDLLDEDLKDDDDDKIKVVYPFGCSLRIKSNKISTVFTSGIISYPLKRPLMNAIVSNSKKGRMVIVGSEMFTEDDYFDKEDNKKIIVFFFIKKGFSV